MSFVTVHQYARQVELDVTKEIRVQNRYTPTTGYYGTNRIFIPPKDENPCQTCKFKKMKLELDDFEFDSDDVESLLDVYFDLEDTVNFEGSE